MEFLTATVKTLSDAGTGSFEGIASMPTIDRDAEIVAAGAFAPLPKRVPLHLDHRLTSEGLVGTGVPAYDGDRLRIRGTFAGTPRAQEARQLVREGHLGSMSVGFITLERGGRNREVITRAELIEVSLVTVGSNRDALVLSARGYGGNLTVTEVRKVANQILLDLAAADMAEARRIMRQVDAQRLPRGPAGRQVHEWLRSL